MRLGAYLFRLYIGLLVYHWPAYAYSAGARLVTVADVCRL